MAQLSNALINKINEFFTNIRILNDFKFTIDKYQAEGNEVLNVLHYLRQDILLCNFLKENLNVYGLKEIFENSSFPNLIELRQNKFSRYSPTLYQLCEFALGVFQNISKDENKLKESLYKAIEQRELASFSDKANSPNIKSISLYEPEHLIGIIRDECKKLKNPVEKKEYLEKMISELRKNNSDFTSVDVVRAHRDAIKVFGAAKFDTQKVYQERWEFKKEAVKKVEKELKNEIALINEKNYDLIKENKDNFHNLFKMLCLRYEKFTKPGTISEPEGDSINEIAIIMCLIKGLPIERYCFKLKHYINRREDRGLEVGRRTLTGTIGNLIDDVKIIIDKDNADIRMDDYGNEKPPPIQRSYSKFKKEGALKHKWGMYLENLKDEGKTDYAIRILNDETKEYKWTIDNKCDTLQIDPSTYHRRKK